MATAIKDYPNMLSRPNVCVLGDMGPGKRIYSYDLDIEYLITDRPARDGYLFLVQLDTGTEREFHRSSGLFKYRTPHLRLNVDFVS